MQLNFKLFVCIFLPFKAASGAFFSDLSLVSEALGIGKKVSTDAEQSTPLLTAFWQTHSPFNMARNGGYATHTA